MLKTLDRTVFLLGGARSGKSRLAQKMGMDSGLPFIYLATGVVTDREMEERVRHHQLHRPASWKTLEVPYGFQDIQESFSGKGVLLDCVTFLTSNIFLRENDEEKAFTLVRQEFDWLFQKRERERFFWIMVSNEIGMGVVPEYPLGRTFRDLQGRVNQWLASQVDEVYFVIAGLSLPLKPGTSW
ncbi:MAG: bifunctional adenosylcobinamide kinase/adenosylcobinamide-phosphate guanylyltransferase [Candidatus Atribacteria bacterium]|nr:bifunctional adenosylcobinamide kinase/adenosylcobinamide-phosphate guanylyltransferase [Candidatus Atribacteria bacterium]